MKNSIKKFFVAFICACVSLAILLSTVAFAADPQNIFRWNNKGQRIYEPRFSAAGSIKNYDYDFVILGSSMVQNFNADKFADLFDCKPLKVTIGGIQANELLYAYNAVQKEDKAKTYFLDIDLHRIAAANTITEESGRFPEYMFNSDVLSKLKYLMGFETWLKFIPIDAAVNISVPFNKFLPASIKEKIEISTDINSMCSWDNTILPGKEKILQDFHNNAQGFDEGDNSVFSVDAVKNMGIFMDKVLQKLDADENLIIYFPPYSVLYWAQKDDAQFETLLNMKKTVIDKCSNHKNIKILDYQGMPEINNLDLYFDITHHGAGLSEKIENSLNTDCYISDNKSFSESSEFIKKSRLEYVS